MRERPSEVLREAFRGRLNGLQASPQRCLHLARRARRQSMSEKTTIWQVPNAASSFRAAASHHIHAERRMVQTDTA